MQLQEWPHDKITALVISSWQMGQDNRSSICLSSLKSIVDTLAKLYFTHNLYISTILKYFEEERKDFLRPSDAVPASAPKAVHNQYWHEHESTEL